MPLITLAKDIRNYSELRHFSWGDIGNFAVVDRYSISYKSGWAGDWKASIADGFLLVTVGGVPYWTDAIGQIPFAVDTYRLHRVLPNITSHDQAILATIETGRNHHTGNPIPTSNIPLKGHYDEFMIARGAIWASKRFKVIQVGGRYSSRKRLEETNWSPDNLAVPITDEQATKYKLK